MVPKRAGGPGDFLGRLQRLQSIDSAGVSVDAFAFHDAVLRWQVSRNPSAKSLAEETRQAIESLESVAPEPMHGAASVIDAALVEEWLANREVGASVSMWLRIGSAPVLEAVAQSFVISADWTESDCPVCRGIPQVSAIVEESDEFMQGSPRYLICSRCAYWWRFARATCPTCGEHDPKNLGSFRAEAWPWARIDNCESCRSYIKTFDLREQGAGPVVPLIDDLATIALDLWAQDQGSNRSAASFAGV